MMLMDYTDVGRDRIAETASDGLVFAITHVAYGTDGYDTVATTPLPLVPAATGLVAEVLRETVRLVTDDELSPGLKKTVYTSLRSTTFQATLGEAGLIATITDPGTTGYSVGDEFLLAHAHFGRLPVDATKRLAVRWPLDLDPP